MGRRRIHFPERPWRSRTLGCCPEAGGNVGCSIQRRFQANSDTVRDIGRSVTARSNEAYDTSPPPRPCSTPRGLVREKSYARARTRASLARRPLPGLDLHSDPEREHRVPSSTDPAGDPRGGPGTARLSSPSRPHAPALQTSTRLAPGPVARRTETLPGPALSTPQPQPLQADEAGGVGLVVRVLRSCSFER